MILKQSSLRPILYLSSTLSFKRSHAFTSSYSTRAFASLVNPPKNIIIPQRQSTSVRRMTTAYSGEPGDGKLGLETISYLPIETELSCGLSVHIGPFDSWNDDEYLIGLDLMNLIIREGKSWPFEDEFQTIDGFKGYFLSHAAFVVRSNHDWKEPKTGREVKKGDFMGCFYIKPNYPGRCSHICNGGFITSPEYRRMGVARVMGKAFCKLAKDLGYKSSYFNLVFKSNTASVRLWESLGFERVAELKEAANLIGVDGLDTAYGYSFNLTQLPDDFQV